ncbi:calcium-activated chloride channel regulator 2-like [Portunus trituberculatus]|uniref:calcium-activated chloride channel regulator 2-like n=1 Tax=Portunus trituberculatus TaxID=210409 RepID=UPI001E1D0599|nr:calcium-activated chloride channel regulator 2-like [Portunus trituberculatus]
MYLHHLPHVTQFCDVSSHQVSPPTKHNALCSHRSAWSVILEHEDFLSGSNPGGEATKDVTPSFNYVRPVPPRYVIVVEDTAIMNVQKRWEFLRKAVRKLLVYDVPAGSMVGVVKFDQTARTKLPLEMLPSTLNDRQRLATASMPRNPSNVAQSQKCILCGLEEAAKLLEDNGNSAAGGVILLITSGSPLPLTPYDVKQMGAVVTQRGVRVVPILYPVTSRNPKPSPGVETLAQLSGTQSFAVLDEGIGSDSKVSMMVALMDSLYAALGLFIHDAKQLPLMVHKQEYPGGIISISQGTFNIDETLGGEVKFALTYYDLGHVGNTVNLIDPNGQGVKTLHSLEEDSDVNTIFITLRDAMPGDWMYRVENKADSHQSLYMRVWATPRVPNDTMSSTTTSNAISLTAWTSNSISPINISDIENPVVVYAKVWWGGSPVVGARVEASLQRIGINNTGSRYAPHNFLLYDNGNGDSDITRHDGVYSRYLPPLEAPDARYTLTVSLSDNSAMAQIILPSRQFIEPPRRLYTSTHTHYTGQVGVAGIGAQYTRTHAYNPVWPRCCGSVVPYATTRPTGQLSRTVTVGLIDLIGGERSLSHIPPSRIGNLRAVINAPARQITFYWTAPGDQRDHGTAMRYEVTFSRDAANTGQGRGERATEWSSPNTVGTESSHTVRWGRHDGVYYVAIRAVSRLEVEGPWSNTAEVFMPHPPTTTENIRGSTLGGAVSGSVSELGVTTPQPASLSTRNILAIVGAGCGILVVILIMAVYYLVVVTRRRRQKQEKKTIDVLEPATTTPGACDADSETDSITKPPPPADAAPAGEGEMPGKRAMSPIQSWPASTLLAEHEKRHPHDVTDGEGGELTLHQPDLGVPYMPPTHQVTPHPFFYHTPNGHYIEDNLPMDSGSMISTQPSESLHMYKVDSSATDYSQPPSSSAVASTPVSWEAGRRPGPTKVPPPTPPKPTLSAHLTMGGVAATSHGQERKRRNVTQV